ncbi:MAG: NAD(P)-dependent alcohol dehydrogenase [Bacteroidota bacterium]
MKALQYHRYGQTDQLSLNDIPIPKPRAKEVLVKLHYTSLNASDWEFLTGRPAYARVRGLFRPRKKILGSDIAGTVEAVGNKVTEFQVGEAVFGDIIMQGGGLAEYVCAPEKLLVHKPEALSFREASLLPQAGVVALQGIVDKGKVQAGQKILINGGGGGSGTFAIQMAKNIGAEVTAVDNAEKQEIMRELGADHVLDYRKTDFAATGEQYDYILDLWATRAMGKVRRALKPEGRYLLVGGHMRMLFGALLSGRKTGLLAVNPKKKDWMQLAEMVVEGKLKTILDREFSMEEAPEALDYLGNGHAKGKIVVRIR